MVNTEQLQWFVVQTLSGHENRARETILKQREINNLEDKIIQVEIPSEKVSEVKRGKKTTTNRKLYPGYILIQMKLYNEDGTIDNDVWYFIRDVQSIIGFVGGNKPVPVEEKEMDRIMAQGKPEEQPVKPKVQFQTGETVVIKDGAFENFEGVIENVDPDHGKLRLSVSIFGRSTPVEVEYWQVEPTSWTDTFKTVIISYRIKLSCQPELSTSCE